MIDIIELLKKAAEKNLSDLFILAGTCICAKKGDMIIPLDDKRLLPADTEEIVTEIYKLEGGRSMATLLETGDDDFSVSITGFGRFRCNAFRQRGSLSAVLRVVALTLPDYKELGIPDQVIDIYKKNKGLVLVTGSAGSGKSTTLSCIVNKINKTRSTHIITIEDPIEYLHRHDKSIVSQREVAQDTGSYTKALRAALRQAPNVILLGEMRDLETISTAMTAAETGQLVLSTLHTIGAANTIDRIIDVFDTGQQNQIRIQLSMVLQAVVSQQLIPTVDGNVVPAFEIMFVNSAIRNLVREGKVHQIDNVIYSGGNEGMIAMDNDLLRLYRDGVISKENALLYSSNHDVMVKKL